MSDDEVPPPYSEQQLDQKIARALVISVQQPQQDVTDDGEWEQWDDAVFAAAEARRRSTVESGPIESSGSERHVTTYNASRLPVPSAVQPLRIHKRCGSSISGSPGSWAGDMTGESPYESSSSRHALRNGHWAPRNILPDSDDDDRIPPPPFTSLDTRTDGIVRLDYRAGSTPPSPLNSPDPDHSPLPPDPCLTLNGQNQFPAGPHQHSVHFSPPLGTVPRPNRQLLPIPPKSPNYHSQQRPTSAVHSHPISASPHPVLNHSTHLPHASGYFGQYAKSTHPHGVHLSPTYKKTVPTLPSQSQSFAANALYKSVFHRHWITVSDCFLFIQFLRFLSSVITDVNAASRVTFVSNPFIWE
ncbi:hypothetical protein C0992_007351 [Termitomyces sp. T32_za158]|nr:hypothetical protein C0992_007351 [Termitomyces sp. T32_za158]